MLSRNQAREIMEDAMGFIFIIDEGNGKCTQNLRQKTSRIENA
jgi:hypothetical protein